MIAKASSISHGEEGINYALKKDKAEIIDKRYVMGDNGTEIKKEFKLFQDQNHRCKNNDLSFVISPDPKDGLKLTNHDFKEIADDFLKEMNLDKHQSIVIKHSDRNHIHLHLFVNRIDNDGKAYKDSFISKQSQAVADKIAQERDLIRASIVRELNKKKQKDIKLQIFDKHKAVLQQRPKDFNTYIDLMKSSGVNVLPTINKGGRLQGFRVDYKGVNLKASEVHRSMSLGKMTVEKVNPKSVSNNVKAISNKGSIQTPKLNSAAELLKGGKIVENIGGKALNVAEKALHLNPVLKAGYQISKNIISKGFGY